MPKSLSLQCKGPISTKSLQNSFIRNGITDLREAHQILHVTRFLKLFNLLYYVTNVYVELSHTMFQVRKQFVRHIHPDKQEAEMWLDFNGQALRW